MRLHLLAPVILEHRGNEVPLHVGGGAIGHDGPEPARLGIAGRHHTRALAAVFDHRSAILSVPFRVLPIGTSLVVSQPET